MLLELLVVTVLSVSHLVAFIRVDSLTALGIKWGLNEEKMLPAYFQLIRAQSS